MARAMYKEYCQILEWKVMSKKINNDSMEQV